MLNYDALKLTFSDEFNTLDFAKWDSLPRWKHTIINDERQYSVDIENDPSSAVNPYSIKDGVLTISVAPTPAGFDANGQPYTGGLLSTYGSFDQAYGYFEMRAQLPAGSAIWPAFWMLPSSASLPEFDIIESSGRWSDGYLTNMHGMVNGAFKSHGHDIVTPGVNNTTEFHRYGLNWQADKVQWYFDGNLVAEENTPPGFDLPMYMMLSVGVAGGTSTSWAGSVNSSNKFPAEYKIDYVRAYSGDADAPFTPPVLPPPPLPSVPPGADLKLPVSPTPTKTIVGTSGDNVLNGTTGADKIDGRGGLDTMSGGRGGDNYVVDRSTDKVIERAGEGTDTVLVLTNAYILPGNVENGTIGSAFAFIGGNAGDNRLTGGPGGDLIIGGRGNDLLAGKAGSAGFAFRPGDGLDVITDFKPGTDKIELQKFGFTSLEAVLKTVVDTPTGSALNLGAGQAIHLLGVEPGALKASDFMLTSGGSDAGWLW